MMRCVALLVPAFPEGDMENPLAYVQLDACGACGAPAAKLVARTQFPTC
jgi:hypothetical protein